MKIFSQSPSRIGIAGGGSDIPEYYNKYNGLTLSFAINIRQKTTLHINEDIDNQYPKNSDPEFYNTILKEFEIEGEVGLTSTYDGTIKGGLGSSASAAVALIGAINKHLKLGLDRSQIAEKAWDIEVNKQKLFGGKQDQYCASYGGINVIEYSKNKVKVNQMPKSFIEPLLPYLVLLHSGLTRRSPKIQENLKELSDTQIQALTALKSYALTAIDLIGSGKISHLGEMMNEIWEVKKLSNNQVSNLELNLIYDQAIKNGAWGGKLLGSGGGGHFLFIVPPDQRESFIKKMALKEVDFSLTMDGVESRVL